MRRALAGRHDEAEVICLTRRAVKNLHLAIQSERGRVCEQGAVARGSVTVPRTVTTSARWPDAGGGHYGPAQRLGEECAEADTGLRETLVIVGRCRARYASSTVTTLWPLSAS